MISPNSQKKINLKGFSLVEITVVLAILGIVFAGFSGGLSSFYHSSEVKESQKNLANIKKQVLQFGMVHKYLPCPDTDGDGLENRNALACFSIAGNAPYLDLGLKESEVRDAWGNFIRYAVNTDSTNVGLICNKTSAASMFCNAGSATSTAWFNLTQTPPINGDRGVGNYYVCNEDAITCTGIPAADNLETDSAVVVLVAYNQDGGQTLASCLTQGGAIQNNCDTSDNHYHQAARTNASTSFFDDDVIFISGYEVKAKLLSSLVSWNNYSVAASTPTPLTPTFETFDISTNADVSAAATSDDDVVLVNRNVSEETNFGDGDDYIAIGNNLEGSSDLSTGEGNDTLYIVGQALSDIDLGDGDDVFVLETNLTNDLRARDGNDRVWIKGDVMSGSDLRMGADDDTLWVGTTSVTGSGTIGEVINGQTGYDILILENVSSWADFDSSGQNEDVKNFELIIFSDDGTGNRNYHECSNDANDRCTN